MRTRSAKVVKLQQPPSNDGILDMTLRSLLERVLDRAASEDYEWVNIRDPRYPWRHIVAAAERGECKVSRVGRKLLMQRGELNKFLSTRLIVPRGEAGNDVEHEYDDVAKRALAEQGIHV